MGRRCLVCDHPEKAAIDEALLAGRSSFRSISAHYGISVQSLARHKKNHLGATLPTLPKVTDAVQGPVVVDGDGTVDFDDLVREMVQAKAFIWQIISDTVFDPQARRDCLAALGQIPSQVQLLAKLEVARQQQADAAQRQAAEIATAVVDRSVALEQFSRALDRAYGQNGGDGEGGGVPT